MSEIFTDKNIPTQTDQQRPFLGLLSFKEENKAQFGGRDIEISELFSQVENNGLTIVFGKSGIGKTSLLQAGLIPELQRNFYFPLYFRIDYANEKSPLQQIRDFIYAKLKLKDLAVTGFEGRTLWKYFHDIKIQDGLVTPVLILDQFEETFTVGRDRKKEVDELVTELADLVENRVPLTVQKEYQSRNEMISSSYSEQPYRVIISLREDYLAQIESLSRYLPSIKNSRYRIVQMTVMQAMEAIVKPAKGLVEPDVAKEIIKKLPGVTDSDFETMANNADNTKQLLVEPFLLSLICYQLNEKRIINGLSKITAGLVAEFHVADVINSYYNETINPFGTNVQQGIEDTLLTESGYRKLESLEELQSVYNIDEPVIQTLINKRIIRKELRYGVEYVELIHDVLVPAIKEKRDERLKEMRKKEKSESIRRAIELDRAKRVKYRNLVVGVASLIFVLTITGVLSFFLKKTSDNEMNLKNKEFAQKLLVTAENIKTNYLDANAAALISRSAYLIYSENRGDDNSLFYMDMHDRLEDLGFVFPIFHSNTAVKSLAIDSNNIYCGYSDGKIWKKNFSGSNDTWTLFYDCKQKITSIVFSPDKKFMAVAGVFNNVQLFDLTRSPGSLGKPTELDSLLDNIDGKTVAFSGNGNLVLQTDGGLIAWDAGSFYKQTFNWKPRSQFEITNGKKNKLTDSIDWNKNIFKMPGVNINCMAVHRDKIAIGSDSCIVLITKDSLIKFIDAALGSTSSIQFDNQDNYLYIGNNFGYLFRISLPDYKMESNWNQSGRITSIVCSPNDSNLACASFDGRAAIYTSNIIGGKWKDAKPLLLSPATRCNSPICYSVNFSTDNNYLLAGYEDGSIFKWPVKPEMLSALICDLVSRENVSLDSIMIKYNIDRKFALEEVNRHN
jgi:WD40 repeat protein